MNITEELTEDAEEVKPEVIKRGRGRPKIPEELRKTKPKIISGLARGRPKIHPTTFQKIPSGMKRGRPRKNETVKKQKNLRQLKTVDEKAKVLEIDIGDKAQLSVIKDFTNDDLLDILPVKFVTKSSKVKGRPVKTTISQEIRLMVIKPNNGKYRGRTRKYSNSDDEDYNHTPSSSKVQGQASTSKGRGRPRKYPKVESIDDLETNNSPSTSRGRTRPIKTPKVKSSDYSRENNLSTPKGPGRPRKHAQESVPSTSRGISRTPHISYAEYNDSDYSDGEDDENYNPTSYSQGQGSISKGRGRPRKYPKIEIDDDCNMTSLPSTSKGRGRPRIHPKVEIDNDFDDSDSLTTSGSRGRPRKHSKKTTSQISITSKGRGRPRKHPLIDQSVLDCDSGINESCLPSTSKGPGRPRKYPKVEKPDKPKKGRGRPRKFHVPKPVVDNDAQISVKPKPGRGRPRKESGMLTETPIEEEDDVDIKCEINGNDEYSEESREEENVLPTDESDIEYCISLNSEQTDDIKPDVPVIDVNDEPVCSVLS